MVEVTNAELIALHLWEREDEGDGQGVAAYELSTPGIGDALEVGDTLSARIELLSAISSMREDGLLDERRARVANLDGQRNVYRLTEAGRRLVRDVRDRIQDETVPVIRNGDAIEVPLDAIDEQVPGLSLQEALVHLDDDGVVRLSGDEPADEFVDRRREREVLRSHLTAVEAGTTRTVLVAGESGIGKTALVEHLLAEAADRGFEVLSGGGHGETARPYRPFGEAFADHRDSVPDRLYDADADAGNVEDIADRRRTLFSEVRASLGEVASRRPLAVFVDDLHAADRASLALFDYLASTVEDDPILLLGMYRPEELTADHPFHAILADGLEDTAAELSLDPLDVTATGALVERTLGDRAVPREFVETIYGQTGGHPLFVEAMLATMRDRNAVDPRTGHYPDRTEALVPEQVRTTVDRRLDPLDDDARTVLQQGSVVGDRIPFPVLAAVSELPEPELRQYVDLLVDVHVWSRDPESGVIRFNNDLTRDVVLDRLGDEERRDYHQQIVEALCDVFADSLDAHAAEIAHHLEQAGDVERAIEYYRRAGDSAVGVYAHETAVDAYERALALARAHDRDEEVLSLLERIGDVHFDAGRYDEAERSFEYVRERTDDPETHWETAATQAKIHTDRGEYDAAIELANGALERWDGQTAVLEVCELLGMKGWALKRIGKQAEARELLEARLEMAEELADDEQRARARHQLAMIERQDGSVEDALGLIDEAIAINETRDDKRRLTANLNNLGNIHHTRDDLEAAMEAYERSLELSREIENRELELFPLSNLSSCHHMLGEWDEARERCEEFLDLARELENDRHAAVALKQRGSLHLDLGELAVAREALERALEHHREMDFAMFIATTHADLARLELLQANLDQALDHATTASETAADVDNRSFATACARHGRIYRALGQVEDAIATHETGLEKALACESTGGIVRNRNGLALAHLLAGRPERALEEAEAACEAAAASAEPLLSVEAHAALGQVHRTRGAHEAADDALETALAGARDLGAAVGECEILVELGRLHRDRGDPRTARETLEEALTLAGQTGATLYEHRARSALDSFTGGP